MNPDKHNPRLFALVFSLVLTLIATRLSRTGHVTASGVLLVCAIGALAIGTARPRLINPVHRTGKLIVTSIINVLLTVVFYCVFTPLGVVLKVTKRDILDITIEPAKDTYWIRRNERRVAPESLKRQY